MKILTILLLMFEVIAHRGGALIGNENTLSAFQNAIEMGVDMIELDVHQTADGQLVVCHDEKLNRTTDKKGRIEDMTLECFKQAHALDRNTGKPTDETLPTLAEALEVAKGRCRVLLEIKRSHDGQYEGIEAAVLKMIEAFGMHDEVVVQSFDDAVIETVHAIDSTIRVEKLIFCRLPFGYCLDGHITKFSFEKYAYVASINACYLLVGKKFVRDCHRARKEVKIWTVNKPKQIIDGVDGVISNRPDLMLEARRL